MDQIVTKRLFHLLLPCFCIRLLSFCFFLGYFCLFFRLQSQIRHFDRSFLCRFRRLLCRYLYYRRFAFVILHLKPGAFRRSHLTRRMREVIDRGTRDFHRRLIAEGTPKDVIHRDNS